MARRKWCGSRISLGAFALWAVIAVGLFAGGAVAATTYVITSSSQIKPSVLAQLRGRRGPIGDAGRFSARDVVVVQGAPQQLCVPVGNASTTCSETIGTARCPRGAVVIGGGWGGGSSPAINASVADNHPTNNGTAWEVGMFNNDGTGTFVPYAICAR